MKDYITHRKSLVDNLSAFYSVIWGHFSPTMKENILSMDKYETNNRECKCVWILRQIKRIMYKFEGQRDIFLAMDKVRSTLDLCKQQ